MTARVLGLTWAAVVLGVAYARRPPPRRVRSLAPPRSSVARRSGRWIPELHSLRERVGAWVLRRWGRPATGPDGAFRARRIGGALLATLVVGPLILPAAPAAALVTWAVPGLRRSRAERRRLAALAADLPEIVDLFVLVVGAGFTVNLAVASVARRGTGPLAAELARATREAALGRRLADALDEIPVRAGDAVRPLIAALIASERYGASLSAGLERLADEVRRDRRRGAEETARKVPVKLLFPLVTCTLPAFALLTVAPLIASAIRSLHL